MSRRGVVTIGVMLGIFLSAIEATVVGTALPSIVASLERIDLYGWVVTAYLVTSTVSVPVWGRLADLRGRRPHYLQGIAIFLLGSALSGAAQSMPQLIFFRAIQGLGAGAIMPIGFTMVGDMYEISERARVQGLLSSVWGLSSVVGPLAGGFIAEQMNWRWVFYLNVPPGLLAAALVGLAWREPREPSHGKLRALPVLLLTSSLGLPLLALGLSSETPLALRGALGVAGLLLGAAFVVVERGSPVPLLDLRLFRYPMFRAVAIGGPFSGMCMLAAITVTPLYVQGVLGQRATDAGKILAYLFVVWMIGSVVSPRLALKVGFRPLALAGSALIALGYGLLVHEGAEASYRMVAASMIVIGSGMGLTIAPLLIAVQSTVEHQERGSATALTQFARSLGGTLGVAIISAVLATGLTSDIRARARAEHFTPELEKALLADVNRVIQKPEDVPAVERAILHESLASSLRLAFTLSLAAAGVFFLTTILIPGDIKVVKIGELTHEPA